MLISFNVSVDIEFDTDRFLSSFYPHFMKKHVCVMDLKDRFLLGTVTDIGQVLETHNYLKASGLI